MSDSHIGERMQMPPESIERLPDEPAPAAPAERKTRKPGNP